MPETAEQEQRFTDRLVEAVGARGPLCGGIDPSAALLRRWGLEDSPEGLRQAAHAALEGFAETTAAVKVQVAFFERHGPAGFTVLAELLEAARERSVLLIADAKRGDISTTAAAYAEAWLAPGAPFAADAVTVTAYLGLAALEPMLEVAEAAGRGCFVVVSSSNPEGRGLQEARQGLTTVEGQLLADLGTRNRAEGSLGSFGAVVGATRRFPAAELNALAGPLLVPGLGAQGATVADVAANFAGVEVPILVSTSRALLDHGPDPRDLALAASELSRELSSALR